MKQHQLPDRYSGDFRWRHRKPYRAPDIDTKSLLGRDIGLYWLFRNDHDLYDLKKRYRAPEESAYIGMNPQIMAAGNVVRPAARLHRIEPDIDAYLSAQAHGTWAVEFYRGNTNSSGALVTFYDNYNSANYWDISWQNSNQMTMRLVVGGVTLYALAHEFSSTDLYDHIKVVGTGGPQGARMWVWRNGVLEADVSDASTKWLVDLINPDEFAISGMNRGASYTTHAYIVQVIYAETQWDTAKSTAFFNSSFSALKRATPRSYFIPSAGSPTLKTITDAAAANDTLFPAAALALADAATGSETTGLGALLGLQDQGLGAESLAPGATLAIVDSGAGNDSQQPAALVPIFEAALGADQVGNASVTVALTDTAFGNDAVTRLAEILKTLMDSASGTDAIGAINVALPVVDVALGSDAPSIGVAAAVADAGTGADAITRLAEILKTLMDTAFGADALGLINVVVPVVDTGAGADTPAIGVTLSLADLATASDLVSVITDIIKSVLDAGAGVDALGIAAVLAVTELSSAVDQPAINVQFNLQDTGAGIDALNLLVTALKQIQDAATGVDALSVSVAVPVFDDGMGIDLPGTIAALLQVVEAAGGTDAIISFDTQINIATITFALKQRSIGFALSSRSIAFNLKNGGSL